MDREIAALYREVYAQPDLDEPRLVLADALQAIGDPRGELIALQLPTHHAPPPPLPAGFAEEVEELDQLHGLRGLGEAFAAPDRIRALVRRHGEAWLGSLAEIAARADFVRGFPGRLQLSGQWDQRIDEPALATVEELLPGALPGDRYAQLVTNPMAKALRRIELVDAAVIRALESTSAPLAHVAIPERDTERFGAVIVPALMRFESLRSLAIHQVAFEVLAATSIFERLTSLTLAGGDLDVALSIWDALPRHFELRIAATPTLPPLASGLESPPLDARELWLRRDGDAVIARIGGKWAVGQVDLVCERVRKLTTIELALVSGEVHRAIPDGIRARSVPGTYSDAIVDVRTAI